MEIDENISVVPYDEKWNTLFQSEKANLLKAFGEDVIDIQHFGSTSVQGMIAKPIVDVLIGVKTLELNNSVINNLIGLGYEGFGEIGVGRLYFRKRQEYSFNLAVVIWNGEQWVNNLLIRNYLRDNPDVAKHYSEKKLKSIKKGYATLLSYSDEKADFVYNLLEQAKKSFE
ncbi:GrpB family protein [Paenibacillus peoriae]|uniref:GrpB family protein n=1 Tax=Paenibacillus peoriae TaxID=59893 RepID=UPI00026C6672|nr:GrpB family protein [Paenibacillus peoriae]MEC0182573.1 GrpB family protein [Paenibacillus peoriae]